jgi:hypothetical protein
MVQQQDKEASAHPALTLFYCYAHKDKALRDEIDVHLAGLHRSRLITSWHDAMIIPGADWEHEIDTHLNAANIILLLVSPDFLNSDYCYGREMQQAIDRHTRGKAHVIPILLRPVDWQDTPFSTLQMLPTNAKPVTQWIDREAAFADIARAIRRAANDIIDQKHLQEGAEGIGETVEALAKENPASQIPSPDQSREDIADISFSSNSRDEEIRLRQAQEEKRRLPEETAWTRGTAEERQYKEGHPPTEDTAQLAKVEDHAPSTQRQTNTQQRTLPTLRRLLSRIPHASAFFGGLAVQVADLTWLAIITQTGGNGTYLFSSDPYLNELSVLIFFFAIILDVLLRNCLKKAQAATRRFAIRRAIAT